MTQDGYDWPNNVQDERWPADKFQPAAPYFREQMDLRKWRCATCWDTGVIRHPPMLGDEWLSRVERCPSPVHKAASDEVLTFRGIPLQFDTRESRVAIHDGTLYLQTR